LYNFLKDGSFPLKTIWKNTVKSAIKNYEQNKWAEIISNRNDMAKYYKIYFNLTEYRSLHLINY